MAYRFYNELKKAMQIENVRMSQEAERKDWMNNWMGPTSWR